MRGHNEDMECTIAWRRIPGSCVTSTIALLVTNTTSVPSDGSSKSQDPDSHSPFVLSAKASLLETRRSLPFLNGRS